MGRGCIMISTYIFLHTKPIDFEVCHDSHVFVDKIKVTITMCYVLEKTKSEKEHRIRITLDRGKDPAWIQKQGCPLGSLWLLTIYI